MTETKIKITENDSIVVKNKGFYELKNRIKLEDEEGNARMYRFVPLRSGCYLLVPEDLVKKTEATNEMPEMQINSID